ncbi:MAG: phospho-N-acetylmuramoyl-pentapeptide-transferase [Oscillospiraceae bacterium]|nr:phospho-N-acetylmuramoyl-pentapeptide-transferase [Oscillospiraceae bacterium]
MTLTLILSFLIGLVLSAAIGAWLVPFLRRIKAGQSIKEIGPTWHKSKEGTPTMGGLMFILAVTVAVLALGWPLTRKGEWGHVFVLIFSLIYGAIGFLDDFEKLRRKQNLGLTARQKFLLQLAVAVAFIYLLRNFGLLHVNAADRHAIDVYIPFWNITFPVNDVIYVICAAFIVVGTVNAVNITDGVDGLAAGSSLPVFVFYTVLCFCWGERYLGLGLFASALTGGLLGFLVWNFNPAKIFMGDTGSLFLGGAVVAMAFAYDMPLILITLGIVFIIETLSDIIQVVYFKATHGKRIFKMAPFHHHLEMGGWTGKKWKEKELFVLFTFVSGLFAVISFLGVRGRF